MGTKGAFGYIIGKSKKLMYTQYDSNYLWSKLIRELYIIFNCYDSYDDIKDRFEKLKDCISRPTKEDQDNLELFTDTGVSEQSLTDWYCLTRKCQGSFTNVLKSGYMLNNGNMGDGFIFILDFNKCEAVFSCDDEQLEIQSFDEIKKKIRT